MDLSNIDKTTLKSILREVLAENTEIYKDLIKEILIENNVIGNEINANRKERIEKMINEDFDKYDDTFKALA